MKKLLSTVLALCMVLTLLPTAVFATGSYGDTRGHWAEDAIERWSACGVIQGDKGQFRPNGALTRAHMAAILSRLLKLPEAASAGFLDVADDAWYADAIDRCAAAGILRGDGGYAHPDQPITRQQAMVMLCRALGIAPLADADLSRYSDGGAVSAYAVGYVAALTQAGYVQGTSDSTLSPYAQVTRAATVTILDRAIEVYANEPDTQVTATGSGLVLVVADGVQVTAPEGTTVTVATGVTGASVNGTQVAGGETAGAAQQPASSATGGGSGGSSGSSSGKKTDITVDEASTLNGEDYTGKTVRNVTITDAVGNGEVTLKDMTITGNLIVKGGGSHSIVLDNCTVQGKVIMDKAPGNGTESENVEPPRLAPKNGTQLPQVEVKQPAIVECGSGDSCVENLTAQAEVTIQGSGTGVKNVTVPSGKEASVTVTGGAKVDDLTVKGEATVAVTGSETTVNTIVISGSVTITAGGEGTTGGTAGATAGKVNTVEIPEDAPTGATVTIEASVTVTDLCVNGKADITNDGTINGISTDRKDDLGDLSDHYFGSNGHYGGAGNLPTTGHVHDWKETSRVGYCDTVTYGVINYECSAEGCNATMTVVLFPYGGHDWGEWTKLDATQHQRVCKRNDGHTETEAHDFANGVCRVCGYEQAKTYPIWFCHTLKCDGTVQDALKIEDGKVTITVPDVGSATNGEDLPVPTMRKGWTYGGWGISATSSTGAEVFYEKNCKVLTDDLAAKLISAVNSGCEIAMINTYWAAIGTTGPEGFSISQSIASGDLEFTVTMPDSLTTPDSYQLNLVSFENARAFSYNLNKDDSGDTVRYVGKVPAAVVRYEGVYFAYEVVDASGSILASDYNNFDGFRAGLDTTTPSSSFVSDPVVKLDSAKSTESILVYEISGMKADMNYQVYADGRTYYCGTRDNRNGSSGSIYVRTNAAHPLPTSFTIYHVAASHPTGTCDTLEISRPITVTWDGKASTVAFVYGVIYNLQWKDNGLENKDYAAMTFYAADGSKQTLEVTKFNDGTGADPLDPAGNEGAYGDSVAQNKTMNEDWYDVSNISENYLGVVKNFGDGTVGITSGFHADTDVDVTRGASGITLGSDTYAADSSTVFLVKTEDADAKAVYTSYTGISSVPSIEGADVTVVLEEGETTAAFVYIDATNATFIGDIVIAYVASVDASWVEKSQTYQYTAYVGATKTTVWTKSADLAFDEAGLYELKLTSDGKIVAAKPVIDKTNGNLKNWYDGTVTIKYTNGVVGIDGTAYNIPSAAEIYVIEYKADGNGDPTDTFKAVNELKASKITVDDEVCFKVNDNAQIVMLYVMNGVEQ